MIDESIARSKKELLLHYLGKFDSLLVAFSGGVDSSFLLASAQQALGGQGSRGYCNLIYSSPPGTR